MPGPKPAPPLTVSRAFRDVICREIQAGTTSAMLARLAGFPNAADFSTTIHAKTVKGTPAVVERLRTLAELLEFPSDRVFISDEESAG
jgi:hypothetical protein